MKRRDKTALKDHVALADPEQGWLDDLVDIDRYPIHDPDSAHFQDLIGAIRKTLDQKGAATLPGFLTPAALDSVATHLHDAARHVPIRRHLGTVYARNDLEAELQHGDPRTVQMEWNAGHVTRDMIPPHAAAQRLYVSPIFKWFVAGCVSSDRVFEYADPLAGLVATIMPPGGQYPWHYDTNEFVVSIMIQKPQSGGRFEYHKDLRCIGNENLDGLDSVLRGKGLQESGLRSTGPRVARMTEWAPGDLQIFRGRYSLHRVTTVHGSSSRHVLVLSYADRPGVIGPLDRTRSVYGRVTEAHLVAAETRHSGTDGLIL